MAMIKLRDEHLEDIVNGLVENFELEWCGFILHGSECTYYQEKTGDYIIFDEPVLVISEDEIKDKLRYYGYEDIYDDVYLDIVAKFVGRFGEAKRYCNDPEAFHFVYEDTLFHVCVSDPCEIAIYVERWF